MQKDTYNYLINNPSLLNSLRKKSTFSCDLESLTWKNLKQTKKKEFYSDVYLWAIKATDNKTIWGTNIDDFWATMCLINNHKSVRTKVFYFVNLSWDYEFFKNKLYKNYKEYPGKYIDFLKRKKEYLEGDYKYDKFFIRTISGSSTISIQLLIDGKVLLINCLFAPTLMGVKQMENALRANKIETVSKLKDEMDYDLVDDVYSRKQFFKLVYPNKPYNNKTFLDMELNPNNKYGYLLKYVENDVIIPLDYYNFHQKNIRDLNTLLQYEPNGIIYTHNNKNYYILNEIDKPHDLIEEKRNYGTKGEYKIKTIQDMNFKKVVINNANDKMWVSYVDFENKQQNIKTNWTLIKNKPIWVHVQYIQNFNNFKVGFEILDSKYFKVKPIKQYLTPTALTFSSLSFKGFRNYIGHKKFKEYFGYYENNILTLKEYDVINRAYMGGMTSFNKKLKRTKGNVLSIDINSSYPYQLTKPIPYGKPLYTRPKKGNYIGFVSVNIINFNLKKEYKGKIPPFFYRKKTDSKIRDVNNRIGSILKSFTYVPKYKAYGDPIHYNGIFNGCFLEDEWKFHLKYYDIEYEKDSYKIFYFNTKPLVKPYIDILKTVKLTAKEKATRDFGKVIMNGLYGKFAQRVIMQDRLLINLNDPFDLKEKQKIIDELVATLSHIDINGQEVYCISKKRYSIINEILDDPTTLKRKKISFIDFKDIDKKVFSFKVYKVLKDDYFRVRQVGATITWGARKQLLEAIINIGYENVKYWDTDSVYFMWNNKTKKIFNKLIKDKKIEIHDTKLGAWSYEKKLNSLIVLKAKQYQYHRKAKYIGNNKWKKETGTWDSRYDYVFAGLKNPQEAFEKVGHYAFKKGTKLKQVSLKKKRLVQGAVLKPYDYELK